MPDLEKYIAPLKQLVVEAGEAILEVYESDSPVEVDQKADDSPVTKADCAAHIIIDKALRALEPDLPVLSEEGGIPGYPERASWQRYWLVDPLDGTKEFINKNGEFTVNIALIDGSEAVLGIVYVPVTGTLYYGARGLGAWKEHAGERQPLKAKAVSYGQDLRVVGSRRHGAEALDTMLAGMASKFNSINLVSMGSSLKICALAEGSADWYPRLALTSEWDTAAAHAVLSAAGGKIVDGQFKPLTYNQKESLLNPFFHAVGDIEFDWNNLISATGD